MELAGAASALRLRHRAPARLFLPSLIPFHYFRDGVAIAISGLENETAQTSNALLAKRFMTSHP